METKRARVVMLPTEKGGVIAKGSKLYNISNKDIWRNRTPDGSWTHQHLYFITDDEIKSNEGSIMGDWCWNSKYNKVFQMNGDITEFDFKIVATTDPKLNSLYDDWKESYTGIPPKKSMVKFPKKNRLPQPSQAFIEKYCKVGGIDEVLIEYVENQYFWGNNQRIDYKWELKIDSTHNTITIHPIKDSWSREEVINLLNRLSIILYPNRDSKDIKRKLFMNNWIKDNL